MGVVDVVSPFENGQPVSVRGWRWTVSSVERGADCDAVSLRPDESGPEQPRTLLTPFDRFHPISRSAPRIVAPSPWLETARQHLAGMRPPGGLTSAERSHVRLLAWQLEPVLAMWRYGVTRVLIADAVGLGKTIQASFLIAELCGQSIMARILVLVPAGLREQWGEELMRHFEVTAHIADAEWLAQAAQGRPPSFNPWSPPGVYVASHDFVKRPEVLRPLEDVTWDLVVLDEAHAAAINTDRRAAADALARRSRRVILLTATPPADDHSQFDALCRIGSLEEGGVPLLVFRRTRQGLGAALPRRSRLHLVQPSTVERRMHDLLDRYTRQIWQESTARGDEVAKLVTTVLRKRALSSAGSLLTSIRRRAEMLLGLHRPDGGQLPLPLADEEPLGDADDGTVLGVPGMSDSRREQRWLGALAEAAQHASRGETKTRYLVRLLGRVNEPAIVFTEYRDTLQSLERACAAAKIATVSLHGGLSPTERSRIRRVFTERPCTLLATDAAAEGLNLHARCRFVIHYELPWSLSRLEQRTGRVDRMGQTRRVHEIGLVAADTAEGLVLAPLAARASRARSHDTFANGLASAFTESRVAALIMAERQSVWTPPRPIELEPVRLSSETSPLSGDEASEEVRRLLELRAVVGLPGHRAHGRQDSIAATSIPRRRSGLSPGLYSVYRITSSARNGRTVGVHSCVACRSLEPGEFDRLKPSALRRIVARLARTIDPATLETLSTASAAAADAAADHVSAVTARLARRELALKHAQAGASRQLVQAGLFDGRAMREAARRSNLAQTLHDESDLRLDALGGPPIVGLDVQLIAVLQVAHGGR